MMYAKVLLAAFLLVVVSEGMAQDSAAVKESAARGKLIFEQNCLACHQADGSGVPNLAPPLIRGVFVGGEKGRVIGIVLEGLQGVDIRGEYYANPMPAFGYLDDRQIADVLTFVRTNFSNKASAVTSDDVKAARRKDSSE